MLRFENINSVHLWLLLFFSHGDMYEPITGTFFNSEINLLIKKQNKPVLLEALLLIFFEARTQSESICLATSLGKKKIVFTDMQ